MNVIWARGDRKKERKAPKEKGSPWEAADGEPAGSLGVSTLAVWKIFQGITERENRVIQLGQQGPARQISDFLAGILVIKARIPR